MTDTVRRDSEQAPGGSDERDLKGESENSKREQAAKPVAKELIETAGAVVDGAAEKVGQAAKKVASAAEAVVSDKKQDEEWPEVYAEVVKHAEDLIEDPDKLIDVDELMSKVQEHNDRALSGKKVPLVLKIFGLISILASVVGIVLGALIGVGFWLIGKEGYFAEYSTATIVVAVILGVSLFALIVMFLVLGIRLLRNKRRHAAHQTWVMIVLLVAAIVCNTMLFGISKDTIFFCVLAVLLLALSSYLDPELARERRLKRELRTMETQERVVDGTLGRDETGKGFIALDFFNLFWIFIVASILGLVIEVIYHMVIVEPGVYQDRAGVLFGPFSPIYGFGAVLMTLALNRFHDKNVLIIFFVSAVIGGAFEFFVSWFMEIGFGAKAWDYSGTFLSIDGRTNGMFMAMWGVLGVVWIKACLPYMLKLVNMIPWKARYTVTSVCAALMIVNGIMTLQSLDCWYERLSGKTPESRIEVFYDEHFDNAYMAHRFQSMTITPDTSSRADKAEDVGTLAEATFSDDAEAEKATEAAAGAVEKDM